MPAATPRRDIGGSIRTSRPPLARIGVAAAIVAGIVSGSGLAWGVFSGNPAGQTNAFTAGSLSTPNTPVTIHPSVTGSGDGNVTLTWSDTLSRAVTFLVERASAATPTSWATIDGAGAGQSSATLCTGTVPGTVSCTYLDNAADSTSAPVYDQQYVYQVVATIGNWTSPSGGVLAQSLAPTSGTDTSLVVPALTAVSASGPASVWAVGQACTVDHSNGTTWTQQTVPGAVCPTGTTLTGVAADGGSPMVVGAGGVTFICTASCTSTAPTLAAKSTTAVGSPDLNGVSAQSSKAMWAVGPNCTVLAYNGTAWSPLSVPTTQCPTGTTLNAVYTNNGHPIFAGNSATLFLCSGGTCTTAPTWTTITVTGLSGSPNLYGVSGLNGSTAWAVGASGTIATCTSGCNNASPVWATQNSGTTNMLDAVGVQGTNVMYAVGAAGTVVKCTSNCSKSGTTWTAVTSNTTASLNGVAVPTSATAFAVGASGTADTLVAAVFMVQSSGLSASVAVQYSLTGANVTALSAPDGSLYTDQAPWPSTALGTACGAGTPSLLLTPSPTVPSGSWSITSVVATVVFQTDATPGTGAAFQLLVSANAGTSWTAYSLTAPGTGGAAAQTTQSIGATVSSTSQLQNLRLCFEGTSGSGTALTTSVNLVHVDVN